LSELQKTNKTLTDIVVSRYKITLESKMTSMTLDGYLIPPVDFNLENLLVSGMIEIDPRYQNKIGLLSMENSYYGGTSNKTFVPIDNYDHVYTTVSKSLNNSITIYTEKENFIFYNVYLNRYKSDEKLFKFMAQAALDNLLKFEQQFTVVPPKQLDR